MNSPVAESISISVGAGQHIEADLTVPERATGIVVFAHGSGSGRFSMRNRAVAESLQRHGFGTLLLDLLTKQEEAIDVYTREYRFDIERLGRRLIAAIDWLRDRDDLLRLPTGCFVASTGAAAALIAAAERSSVVRAVVSRGGRPDLAGRAVLTRVVAPTLLIVGEYDQPVIDLNEQARTKMRWAHVEVVVVAGATHLFEEIGTLEEVEAMAAEWFERYLTPRSV